MRSGQGSTEPHFGMTLRGDSAAPAWLKRLEEPDHNAERPTVANEQPWYPWMEVDGPI